MKISSYNTPLIRADNPNLCGGVPISNLSWVVNWNNGVTEGGSSGSPLFDQNHRIVGQLGGGPSACNVAANCRLDGYGRFDNSWIGGGTNATRLSNWLDPSGSNAVTTNTTNVSLLTPATPVLTIAGNPSICSGTTAYTLNYNGLAFTGNINWTSSNTSIATASATGNPATLTATGNGIIKLTAVVSDVCGGDITIFKQNIIVGSPTPIGIVFDTENPLCINERFPRGVKGASVLGPIADADYEWRVNNIIRGNNEPGINIIHSWCITGTNTVSVRSFFCSTWSNPLQVNFEAQYCEPEGFRSYVVSPNPATNTIFVESKGSSTIEEIRIKDKFGNTKMIKKYPNKNSRVLFDISTLPSDIYIVEIFDGKKWHLEKVIKN